MELVAVLANSFASAVTMAMGNTASIDTAGVAICLVPPSILAAADAMVRMSSRGFGGRRAMSLVMIYLLIPL